MLFSESLTTAIREVGAANGDALLLDASQGRALITDANRVFDLCKGLRRAGFTSFIDFTGAHNGGENFTLYLTLRAPEQAHARLTLKWKWAQLATYAPCDSGVASARPGELSSPTAPDRRTGSAEREPREAGELTREPYNGERGAGQSGDELQAGPVPQSIHPSLSTIWPAAAVAEREIFEMFGIPFAGNALEPLLLDEAFVGHPLRQEFAAPSKESYVETLLQQRHIEGLITAIEVASGEAGSLPAYTPDGKSVLSTQGDGEIEHSISGQAVRSPELSEPSHD
jgi:hypothetical protein